MSSTAHLLRVFASRISYMAHRPSIQPLLCSSRLWRNISTNQASMFHFVKITNSAGSKIFNQKQSIMVNQIRHSGKPPLTVDFIRERILLVLRLFDKINPDKLTIDSHFYDDLGLDSLDHVEIIMSIEDEFNFEIPDVDAEKLNTPRDILNYIQIKEEIYPELEHHSDSSHKDH